MIKKTITIPLNVPPIIEKKFIDNYSLITKNTQRLFLFSCDQKIEHLNSNFYGPNIHSDAMHPEHIFRIAQEGTIGALATHPGLIVRYARKYTNINYIAKLNAKTNLVPSKQCDPISQSLWNVQQVINLKKECKLKICGVGFTVYLGSEYESEMLKEAASVVYAAQQHGLVTILWMYLRGKAILNEQDHNLVAGAAGVANSLGADFVKIKPPIPNSTLTSAQLLKIVTAAAGNTKVICSGGNMVEPQLFLKKLYDQIHIGNTAGCATGRNILQHSLSQAINMTRAIASIVYKNSDSQIAIEKYI